MKIQSDSLKLLADRLFWLVTWHLAGTDMPLTSEMTVTQSDALTDDMLVTCRGDNGEMPLDYMEKLSITVLIDGLLQR